MLKRLIGVILIAAMVFSLCACTLDQVGSLLEQAENLTGGGQQEGEGQESGDGSGSSFGDIFSSFGGNEQGDTAPSGSGSQQGTAGGAAPSGYVVKVESDTYAPNAGSQAEKYWHVKEIKTVCEFDKDGKCLARDTVYYLKSASDYENVKQALDGGWKAVWSSDKQSFTIDQGFKDYTTVDDAYDDVAKYFRGYTVTYSGGGTKYVAPPTEEQKVRMMKEIFGFTFDDIKTSLGKYEYTYTRFRDKVMVTYKSGAGVSDINALAKAAFPVCAAAADEGKMYDYLGKYGKELTAAPETDNIFWSAKFNYFRNGKEIAVEVQILNSDGYDNTLALLIALSI